MLRRYDFFFAAISLFAMLIAAASFFTDAAAAQMTPMRVVAYQHDAMSRLIHTITTRARVRQAIRAVVVRRCALRYAAVTRGRRMRVQRRKERQCALREYGVSICYCCCERRQTCSGAGGER